MFTKGKDLTRSFFIGFLLLVVVAPASAGTNHLQRFFKNTQDFQAKFSQVVKDEKGRMLQQSSGTMKLLRPGKFRWDYTAPFVQKIIANGERVWIYDEDLEQVTVKTLDNSQGSAALLVGDYQTLVEMFSVTEVTDATGRSSVSLVPMMDSEGFRKIKLSFHLNQLEAMQLTDSFGQTTQISFSDMLVNQSLSNNLFTFKIPAGVDVIDEQSTAGH